MRVESKIEEKQSTKIQFGLGVLVYIGLSNNITVCSLRGMRLESKFEEKQSTKSQFGLGVF